MARQIVTPQAVTEVAEALVADGIDPSILAVQSRIGGGSYSTVKRYLDAWKQERAAVVAGAVDTPAAIQAKGQEFAQAVWALASREAQREAQALKDEARAEVAAVRADLLGATAEIARLEAVEGAQAATIETQQVKLRELELSLAQAHEQARRVSALEQALAQLRLDLEMSRQDATDKAVEAGRLTGEADALRAQVRELMAALKPQP
jgi:ethanolamine utilization protein EutA (predicted chaperonin)